MSLFGNLFGSKNSTSTQTTGTPAEWEWFSPALSDATKAGTTNYFNNPGYQPAGFTGDQTDAQQGIRDIYNYGMNNRQSGNMDRYVNDNQNFSQGFTGLLGRAENAVPLAAQYATTGYDDIAQFANPFYQGMTDTVVGRLNDSRDTALNQNAATAAQRSAFGGSGEALARANIDRDTSQQIADASKGIAYDAYGQGANIALNNTANQNNAIARTVAAIQNSANYDMSALGQADNAYTNYLNRGINTVGAANDILGNEQSQLMQAAGLLSDSGDKQQALNQAIADQDWTTVSRLLSLTGLVPQTTTTKTPTNNSGGLGAAVSLAGMFL